MSVATGLQHKFDWTGVAVGAAVGGAIGAAGRGLGVDWNPAQFSFENSARQLVAGMAGTIAGGASRSLITGTDFGDNILAALPDVIGNTIGNFAAEKIASIGREDINSDLVKFTNEEREAMLSMPVQTVDVPASVATAENGFWFNRAALAGVSDGLTVLALGAGKFPVTNQISTAFIDSRAGYLSGLEVAGNSLTGTVLVQFGNNRRLAVDESSIIKSMSLINQKTSDGYSINLNIIRNSFVNSILHPFSPVVTINIVPTMDGTRAPSSAAYYIKEFDSIVMRPDAPPQFIVHEFGHNLGLSHSGYLDSVMFPSASSRATDHIYLKPREIKGLVNAYRKRLGD